MNQLHILQRRAKNARAHVRNAIFLFSIILSTIVLQILLSVATASGAYEIASLKTHLNDVSRQAESMKQKNDALESPQFLAMKAEQLGMVVNNTPAFLRLSDGAVLGTPIPATAESFIADGVNISNKMLESTLTDFPELNEMGINAVVISTPNTNRPTLSDDNKLQKISGLPSIQTR